MRRDGKADFSFIKLWLCSPYTCLIHAHSKNQQTNSFFYFERKEKKITYTSSKVSTVSNKKFSPTDSHLFPDASDSKKPKKPVPEAFYLTQKGKTPK